jgi:uncharacterized membrane protein
MDAPAWFLGTALLAEDGGGWFWRLLGRFHPMAVHFPIALLLAAALLDAWRRLRRRTAPAPLVMILLVLGAAGAVLAAALGWAAAAFEKPDAESARTLALHRWTGVAVAVLAPLVALLAFRARRSRGAVLIGIYRASLWILVAGVGAAGHYGGMLVFGEGYFASAFPEKEAAAAGNGVSSHPGPAPLSPSGVDFVRDIEPILRNHCIKCHGPEKQKGKLRLDTRALSLKGGESGRAIQPGNGKESLLYMRLLDEDEDSRMPTKEKPLPPEKIELLRAWIDQGAPWPDAGAPKTGTP